MLSDEFRKRSASPLSNTQVTGELESYKELRGPLRSALLLFNDFEV